MAPPTNWDNPQRPNRQRANTTTFPSLPWRRKQEAPAAQPGPILPLSFDELVEALTIAEPSLNHARALALELFHRSPKPRLAVLTPILAVLCSPDSPPALQAAGYDILTAFWSNPNSSGPSTSDRLSCLSLVLNTTCPWLPEIWEARYKALVAFTRSGTDTVGMEAALLRALRSWIEDAFSGLLSNISPEERADRQRSVETMNDFLLSMLQRSEFVARLYEEDTIGVLQLFGGLVDSALSASPPLPPEPVVSSPQSSSRIGLQHLRSSSTTSIPPVFKKPVDFAIELYLKYLNIRLKAIAPDHLRTIIPYLFRALAFYSSPLPRLSLSSTASRPPSTLESRISELLDTLVTGPYSATCTLILKCHLLPSNTALITSARTSLGALRTLRLSIRRALITRMARAYISRISSVTYTPSGAPGGIDLENDLMERAWGKDDAAVWSLPRFTSALCRAVREWIDLQRMQPSIVTHEHPSETILQEITGILLDMSQGLEEVAEGDETVQEEVEAVGRILGELATFVKNFSGGPALLTLSGQESYTPLFTSLSTLFAQNYKQSPLSSVVSPLILSLAEHVADSDTAAVVSAMSERQGLSPTAPRWIECWRSVLTIPGLYTVERPITRQVVTSIMQRMWDFIRDIPPYRRPLTSLVVEVWKQQLSHDNGDYLDGITWRILGEEIVLQYDEARAASSGETESDNEEFSASTHEEILDLLVEVASTATERTEEADMRILYSSPETLSPTSPPPNPSAISTSSTSPVLSRMQSDLQGFVKDAELSMPSVMSLLSSLTSANTSRSQSRPPRVPEQPPRASSPSRPSQASNTSTTPKTVGAVCALVTAFSQLAFTGLALNIHHRELAARIFRLLLDVVTNSPSSKAKITALQFLVRLRVDRDHRVYYASTDYDENGHVHSLAALIGRAENRGSNMNLRMQEDATDARRARPKVPQERKGRRMSRGPARRASNSQSGRSQSRVVGSSVPTLRQKTHQHEQLWSLPETLPFSITGEGDTPSDGLISYDPACPVDRYVLRFSRYLLAIKYIFEHETDWEVLSYALCHLPTQLSNKHLFCGPNSRIVIADLVNMLCVGILEDKLFTSVQWPEGVVARDAHGLVYHILTVLISYKRCFPEAQPRHRLVEVFFAGLNGQPATIKCSLHALSLSAFELQPSMTKYLSRILEKLSQIMSNPLMAVHIIDFLSIVGSLPALHANFTEGDYKMVFGVALQYLQHYNRAEGQVSVSWALSQHVRIMSYYIVYLWFLSMKLPDRPHHVKFITRQLLLANEGRSEVDEPAEVCFDWLARYTYASADPRPANSLLSEIIMNPAHAERSSEPATSQKTWVAGNSLVTIRVLARRGWVEVWTRRASGLTKFLCRAENVPLVTPGDVDPDIVSLPAALALERPSSDTVSEQEKGQTSPSQHTKGSTMTSALETRDEDRPDPITGYVWSGSAPSQRRKDVAIDPSYFALQLSPYPDTRQVVPDRFLVDPAKVPAFIRTLDRIPVIDTHKVGIMYVAPGQKNETEILNNTHGSPAYTRFLEGLGRLINLRGQLDVYAGGLDPDEDGEYAYAWWDDIGQILFHTATLMPSLDQEHATNKKRHIGNDYVRVIWNDSGVPYKFGTLSTQFQFVNIVIEPHSRGAIAAFSNNVHEHEYFRVTLQRAPGMTEFSPIGDFKLISAENLPLLVRQLSLLTDWFVSVFQHTQQDTSKVEMTTNWRSRLQAIKRFRAQMETPKASSTTEGVVGQEIYRDFTNVY
ncbi:hypothetical protein K474DRAFT_1642914 [Panus rudis PR-1116 ss-1]|nr:hypothetical protein K474DRAFT_1642914 [Panus rudis PR-1116 ss-1]